LSKREHLFLIILPVVFHSVQLQLLRCWLSSERTVAKWTLECDSTQKLRYCTIA